MGDPSGRLVGRDALREYFEEALDKLGSSLHLELKVGGGVTAAACTSIAQRFGGAARLLQGPPHTCAALPSCWQEVLVGVDSCCVLYTRETGASVAEVFQRDAAGRARRVQVFYDTVC